MGDRLWTVRRAMTAVLAEVSEQLTHRSFSSRPLDEVVALLARLAHDPDSYNTRRRTQRTLGNLQHFTPEVAAFFEACRARIRDGHASWKIRRRSSSTTRGSATTT